MDILKIDKEKAINAYKQGSEEQQKVLELLFGVETFRPKTVIERVKTFEDACRELGKDHPFVLAYENTNLRDPEVADDNEDVLAYLKLRIITAVLNEGWKPKFVAEERRYFPYFLLPANEEISRMSEKENPRMVYWSYGFTSVSGGLSFAHASGGSAHVFASIVSCLSFKTSELAEYAGKLFADLYADYLLGE